jgi:hypothetical protein
MKPSERHWPAQEAPDDFADRVVEAGLNAVRGDSVEPSPEGNPFATRTRRAVWGWSSAAAALMIGVVGLYLGTTKPEHDARRYVATTELVEAKKEVTRQAREVEQLRAQVAALESQVRDDRTRAELDVKLRAAARPANRLERPLKPSKSRTACKCQPGDALCSCL